MIRSTLYIIGTLSLFSSLYAIGMKLGLDDDALRRYCCANRNMDSASNTFVIALGLLGVARVISILENIEAKLHDQSEPKPLDDNTSAYISWLKSQGKA